MDLIKQAIDQMRTAEVQKNWEQLVSSPFLRSDELQTLLESLHSAVVTSQRLIELSHKWTKELQLMIAANRNSFYLVEVLRKICTGAVLSPKDRLDLAKDTLQQGDLEIAKTLREALYFAHQRKLMEAELDPQQEHLNHLLPKIDLMGSVQTRWVCLNQLQDQLDFNFSQSEDSQKSLGLGIGALICTSALVTRNHLNPARSAVKNALGGDQLRTVRQRNTQINYVLTKIFESEMAELLTIHQQNVFPGSRKLFDLVKTAHTMLDRDIFQGELNLMAKFLRAT